MPEDTEMYLGIIRRLSPDQAHKLANKMEAIEKTRAIKIFLLIGGMILFFLLLFAITSFADEIKPPRFEDITSTWGPYKYCNHYWDESKRDFLSLCVETCDDQVGVECPKYLEKR